MYVLIVHACALYDEEIYVEKTDLSVAPDQTESVAVSLDAPLLCQLHEENRQKEAKGSRVESRKWGSCGAGGREGWLTAERRGAR